MLLRSALPSDAPSLSTLSAELGYPVPPDVMAERLAHLAQDPNHAVFVAEENGAVLGWIDVGISFHLQSGNKAEIGGLVVDATARSRGIGRELLARAEQWAAARGMKKVLLRSNQKRADAHRFYLREKYDQIKTSAVFEKKL